MAAKAVPAEPVSKESQFQVSPSEAQKEHMRLQKKLCQIAKIEERIAAGDEVDRLQLDKVARKEELLARVGEAERRRGEEQKAAEERETRAWQEEQRCATAVPAWQEKRQKATAAPQPCADQVLHQQVFPAHAAMLPAISCEAKAWQADQPQLGPMAVRDSR